MNYPTIKFIDETTDFSTLSMEKKNWDTDIGGVPYQVVKIRGYVHTVGGKYGSCDLWAYPMNEEPTFKNMLRFNAYNPVSWGIVCKPKNHICHGSNEVRNNSLVVVTRNGDKFFTCEARGNTIGIDEARVAISKFTKHPLGLNNVGYDLAACGRRIYYRGTPATICRFVKEQACVMIKAESENSPLPIFPHEIGVCLNRADELKISILDPDISWYCGISREPMPKDDLEAMHDGSDAEMAAYDEIQKETFDDIPSMEDNDVETKSEE